MKKLNIIYAAIRAVTLGVVVLSSATIAKAITFASGITNISLSGSNYVQFIMNEAGANVGVVFEDSSSNNISTSLPAGKTNFFLGTHTSYQIYCTKLGNGTPALITTDTAAFNQWNLPRGIDIIKDPKKGALFGRMIIGNGGNGTTTSGGARGQGLYALNADCSDSYLGKGTNASYSSSFAGSAVSSSSPYRVSINPNDNSIDVADFSTANGTIFKFDPNFQTLTNYVVLGPVGENQGFAAGVHGDPTGVFTTGSIATGDLVVFSADPDLGAPASAQLGFGGNGQTQPGQFNNIFRYDIGSGPLPWTNPPVFAVNVCLPTFKDSQILSVSLGADTNKIYAQTYRANLSDGNIQVFDRNTGNILYNSLNNGADAFRFAYPQVRVSPDGLFIATILTNETIRVASLTNGIPDESSIINIAGSPTVSFPSGIAFDAADNIYEVSQGQSLLRGFSLGITATTITGNDSTGTNGTFQLILPPTVATVAATTPLASQNYINSTPAGIPIPGAFTITLTTNNNALPVAVQIQLSGSATNAVNYNINSGTDANGVLYSPTLVTFPAGPMPGGGNWTATVIVTPTATPKIGPSTTVTLNMIGGANYVAGAPHTATLSIANTGPQFVFLSAASSGTSMNRAIPNDYAKFTLTRWGDTNGPNNTATNVTPLFYTITNFTYLGTAALPLDYGAHAQRLDPAGNGVSASPAIGNPGIVIYPGNVTVTCVVGDPVAHSTAFQTPTNLTVTVNLTNAATGTSGSNGVTLEGYSLIVSNNTVTLTEIDNSLAPEVVIWSNPLTNSLDTNWTLTYANTNLASTTVLPVLIPSYTNGETMYSFGSSNDFIALFGNPISADSVPQSPVMAANGWTTALKMSADKAYATPAAVNVYPQNISAIQGNIALRFDMYLSVYDFAVGAFGGAGREFALFGIDHNGTNANWRPTVAVQPNTGSGPTNSDGQWFAVDAASGSLTPADYDAFTPPPLPNPGTVDIVSATAASAAGLYKNPPFTSDVLAAGGNVANQWVNVAVEKRQSNGVFAISMFIDRSSPLATFQTTNTTATNANYTNGTIMLGYEAPIGGVLSDSTAYVYYSNVRVVELSPFISAAPVSLLVLSGANVSFTNTATYAFIPGITNQWYKGLATPVTLLQTDTNASTNITSTLNVSAVTAGTNYFAVVSDSAGSITSVVANLEVIAGPANVSAVAGTKATFTVTPTGQSAPTSFQWFTNGVALVNGTKYTNVTTASLGVSNVVSADTLVTYVCTVVNPAGTVTTPGATLTLTAAPSSAVVSPASKTNVWGSSIVFTVTASGSTPFTYGWKKGGTNIANGSKYAGVATASLTISNLTQLDAGSYTVGVTNAAGNTLSSPGVLSVATPQPTISPSVALGSGNVTLIFTSTNTFDKSSSFTLQSSPTANGTYTNTPGTITGSAGTFQVTVPQAGPEMFYRLQHQ